MSNEHDAVQDLARSVGPLAPGPEVRARVLASIEAAPQEIAAPLRRPWALGAAAAAVLLGVTLWLGSRSERDPGTLPDLQPATPREPWEEAPEIAKQRAENLASYERSRAALHEKHKGKWIRIEWGSPLQVQDTAEEVFTSTRSDRHAFVFRLGDEGPREAEFFSTWYSPRFAGAVLPGMLGADWVMGGKTSRLTKAGKPAQVGIGPVFPRLRFDLEGPARSPTSGPSRLRGAEVFVGSVGPPLMLTPEDAVALNLTNAEIPGEVTVWKRFKCRQALVKVSVAGWDEPQIVTALWPIEPRAWLTALARERDRFWSWGGNLADMAVADAAPFFPALPPWLLFGRDRVLARAGELEVALNALDADPEPTYHRFLIRWPRQETLALDETKFETRTYEWPLNGRPTRFRTGPSGDSYPVVWIDAADAVALHLDARAEDPRTLTLRRVDDEIVPLQGGFARLEIPVDARALTGYAAFDRRLAVLAVWVLPPPPPASAPPGPPEPNNDPPAGPDRPKR